MASLTYFDWDQPKGGFGDGIPLPPEDPRAIAFQLQFDRTRASLRRLRDSSPRLESQLPPLSPFELQELASMGYGGGSDDFTGSAENDRLSLDGGVWSDQP